MLSGRQIVEYSIVTPAAEAAIQPASVDLTLSDDFFYSLVPGTVHLPTERPGYREEWGLRLAPDAFVLACTDEVVLVPPEFVGRVEGKALALDTEVPTPNGFSHMGDIRAGDMVFGSDGEPTRVLAVTQTFGAKECYCVTFSDYTEVVCDGDHLWAVTSKRLRRKGGDVEVLTTKGMTNSLRAGKEWNYQVALAGAAEYPTAVLPIEPYVLGAWLGDGATDSSNFYSADEDVIHEIRKFYPVKKVVGKYGWRIGSAGFCVEKGTQGFVDNGSFQSELRKLGVLGDKHIPTAYLTGDKNQRLALLQGLMDTDGHCTKLGQAEFSSTNMDIASGVVELAASLGFRPYLYEDRATLYGKDCGPAYRVVFRPRTPVFRLPRKLARQRSDAETNHRFRTIRSIVRVPSVPVRCLMVEAEDGQFLITRNYIPTHNSTLARMGLIVHTTAGFIDPGFRGKITLELKNVGPCTLVLTPGMYICQLSVQRMERVDGVYNGKYQGAKGVEGAKLA